MAPTEVENKGYTVTYDSASHLKVITQMTGSVWPKVLPYCIINSIITYAIGCVQGLGIVDLSITGKGHSFMGFLVAFLVVSRVNLAIGRYNEARGYLGVMYRESRELIQNMVAITSYCNDERSKEWRNEVTYQICILLRVAMGVIDYPEHFVNVWELDELDERERAEIRKYVYFDTGSGPNALRWSHGKRTEYEENMRVPVRLAYLLRKQIRRGRKMLSEPVSGPQEMKFIGSVDSFMSGYFGIRKFLTTPFPFPLVQMARTFLFFYVYTVPFVLLKDSSNVFTHCLTIFILTFGFMGLEYVSIELDNPFGEDDNDFDNLGMAYTAFEDTYLTILELDGPEWTDRLHFRLNPSRNSETNTLPEGESAPLLV
mmetsp:Transcript_38761/g.44273  ORF Transcript_38761/g.44273 Transcript_38761/m.44273 type:complete len:371 (-) Transcript_38761:87-1199(-)|eukprot:CAMPEP_0194132904 /NCGR_PEP_ID=MMETSP0152-20130528/3254_1 /TAXON_ID=1049557 /ORGANISM="Thalassiothrix antarctica, Strain L6-D1" /LENGTH=370 /DNA_ID=CAMNT_0038828097 /DNA_START=56 /DNA_END=1168 /DNA_ORIENTATION=-